MVEQADSRVEFFEKDFMVGNNSTNSIKHDIQMNEIQKMSLKKNEQKKAFKLSHNIDFEG